MKSYVIYAAGSDEAIDAVTATIQNYFSWMHVDLISDEDKGLKYWRFIRKDGRNIQAGEKKDYVSWYVNGLTIGYMKGWNAGFNSGVKTR